MEIKTEKAMIRIHGSPDMNVIRDATAIFLKKAVMQKRKVNR